MGGAGGPAPDPAAGAAAGHEHGARLGADDRPGQDHLPRRARTGHEGHPGWRQPSGRHHADGGWKEHAIHVARVRRPGGLHDCGGSADFITGRLDQAVPGAGHPVRVMGKPPPTRRGGHCLGYPGIDREPRFPYVSEPAAVDAAVRPDRH